MVPLLSIKQFLNDMRRQKLRTLLTVFGVFWGTAAIVLLFAFGDGMKTAQLKSQKGLGDNIAIIWPGITGKEFKGLPRGRRIHFTADDVEMIKVRSETIKSISPEFTRWGVSVKYGKNQFKRQLIGIWPEFNEMRNIIPQMGSRFINDLDIAKRRRVVFIGNRLADDLFGSEEAVGKTILVDGTPFVVIGVMKEKDQDSSYSGRDHSKLIIPVTTFRTMFSNRYPNNLVVQAKDDHVSSESVDEIYEMLGSRYKFDPTDREALMVWDVTQGFEFLKIFFTAFQWFLTGIGIATLITGGIGVSNIMNVVLEERTKEIGIKMALGARRSTILAQFILETLTITGVGGIAGFLFAWGIVALVPLFNIGELVGEPTVDLTVGLIATVLIGIVGFTAGIFPARRAARLEPVKALKLY
ncbi:MAG TPA: ABC transporter permease [candidate division Zixibacteria bacterium]|mgnify:CR=1 FL=1|nr:ABC transporter permease [candidate division Zixibacteria bacterium]